MHRGSSGPALLGRRMQGLKAETWIRAGGRERNPLLPQIKISD